MTKPAKPKKKQPNHGPGSVNSNCLVAALLLPVTLPWTLLRRAVNR